MNDPHFAISVFIVLLLIASGVAMLAKWVRVPYTLLLVVVGLLISPMRFLPTVHMSPELILLIFLPALLFEAAWNLKLDQLRENWLPILMLATAGVGLSVSAVGLTLHFGAGLPWSAALLFGAIISATDPVSVLALFKKLNLPERLATIVEGESLFNDGTAIVVFRIILGVVVSVTAISPGNLLGNTLREFVVVIVGGIAVGAGIGLVASMLTSYFDDYLLEITLTTITAYGSFLLAEALHVSPVIAVLVAGLINGNYGKRAGMSPTTQLAVNSFWEYAAFAVNSLVFLLIGLEIQLSLLAINFTAVVWAVAAMLLGRVLAVYGLMPLTNCFTERIPIQWQHVLVWGGLRGSLSLAMVLSLPTTLQDRSQVIVMTFGTVIFSLLVQGLTVGLLLKCLGFARPEAGQKEYDMLQGQLLAETAAQAELERLRTRGIITERVYQVLSKDLTQTQERLSQRMAQFDGADLTVEREHLQRLQRHLVSVKKARLLELRREGMILEAAYQELIELMDEPQDAASH